jgi:hypothetical protein
MRQKLRRASDTRHPLSCPPAVEVQPRTSLDLGLFAFFQPGATQLRKGFCNSTVSPRSAPTEMQVTGTLQISSTRRT